MQTPLPFTINDISELATDRSFERGEDYYDSGYVGKIVRINDKFEGKVSGSALYISYT